MLDKQPLRPVCEKCREAPARKNGVSVLGYQRWHKFCNACAKHQYRDNKKKSKCERCGFECVDACQMCVIDGQTMCMNCNALRLKQNKQLKGITADTTLDWGSVRL